MRRFFTTLTFITLAAGTVAAQDATFRFASDPFSAEERGNAEKETAEKSATSIENASSYESYETTPGTIGLVQKKAMYRAEQRQMRIEARKWHGFSQSRPVVNSDPYMTAYTPLWAGRNWAPNYYRFYGNRFWY
jgi:hypothetical protein